MEKYGGAWPTMATPYDHTLNIDVGAYRAMVEWYIERGVGGLYANCLTSEMYQLAPDERIVLVQEAVATAAGRVPVAATGNLGQSTAEHIAFCRAVADAGADVVMLVVPDFLVTNPDLKRYYLSVAEQVDAPLGLYECPVPRPYHLNVDIVRMLAQTGRFVAYKETSCDMDKIMALLKVTKDTPLSLLQANTPYLLKSIQAGGLGTMSTAAVWLPDLVAAVIDKGLAGDADAERLQRALCAMHLVQRLAHPHGTKYLLEKRGLSVSARSRSKSPLTPELLQGLDYCAKRWFDSDGNLVMLEK
jgi:4-hydroxy-tetrahydrodipicolinate synthase